MGQKTHPTGFRVGIIKPWVSTWYAKVKDYAEFVAEDAKIRKYVKKKLYTACVSRILIDRKAQNTTITVVTAILQKLNINPYKKVIIYMPTYRKPALGVDAMEKIVRDLYENEQLDDLLNRENFVFLCKLHPATPFIDLKERDNFKILDYKVVDDNQALLGSCDMLVTDYSSCFVDFALLNRPFILYFPDDERFLSMSESMMEEFFELRKDSMCTTIEQLTDSIDHPNMEIIEKTNQLFEDPSIKNTCYSENVFNVVERKLKLLQ